MKNNLLDKVDFSMSCQGGVKAPIANWKIFSVEEQKLSEEADESYEGRIKYIEFYKKSDPCYYNNGLTFIDKILKRFHRTNLSNDEYKELVVDMMYCLHRFGFSFEEYFWYELEKLNFMGRSEFISDKVRYYLYHELNLEENHWLFGNKINTYRKFGKFYGRDCICIECEKDFDKFCDFVDKKRKIMVKPIDGDCGKGAFILDLSKFKTNDEAFNFIFNTRSVILEELIVQSSELAKFHPKSVNTIRLPVIKSAFSEDVYVFHPFFRMGCGEAVVDNGGAGGIFANIDAETGIVYTPGINENGKVYLTHPDTGYSIVGFKIPEWEKALSLARIVAKETTNRYIAFDFALTEKGWVIVEINSSGQFVMQLADKKGRLAELLDLVKK